MFENQNREKSIDNLTIMKGVFWGVVVLLVINTIMALFSNFIFSLSTGVFNTVLITENLLILLFVGFYIARKVDKNGWLNGGIGGLIYMVIIILLGTISMPISIWYILLLAIMGLIIGSIGGIFGINL
jgi:putative membrane protein (TIGR04086 family)